MKLALAKLVIVGSSQAGLTWVELVEPHRIQLHGLIRVDLHWLLIMRVGSDCPAAGAGCKYPTPLLINGLDEDY